MLRHYGVLLPLVATSCAGLATNDQGRLQPQTVSGPCQVSKFFLERYISNSSTMTVANTGAACSFTLLNPAAQIILNAALVTTQPQHGQATAAVISGRVQAGVSYTPQPGYAGPDAFAVTLEPNDAVVTVHVVVGPQPAR